MIPYGKDKNCPDAAEIRAIWAAQAERHSAAGRRRETVQLYQDGVPVREIARCLGFAGTAGVYDALRSAGVPPNRGGRAPQPREKVDPVVTFVRYLAELGRTETQIMTALGVPRVRVAAILRDMQKGPAA